MEIILALAALILTAVGIIIAYVQLKRTPKPAPVSPRDFIHEPFMRYYWLRQQSK